MKKIIALVLALMLFMLAGCGNDEALAAKQAEVDELKAQLSAMENAPGAPTVHQIHAVNATVEGKTTVDFTEAGSFTATAALEACEYRPKIAIVMVLCGVAAEEAKEMLAKADGRIAGVLGK